MTIHWPCLKELCLDNNGIGNKGMRFLVKASWNKLEILSLCIYFITQTKITSELKVLKYSTKLSGLNSKNSGLDPIFSGKMGYEN